MGKASARGRGKPARRLARSSSFPFLLFKSFYLIIKKKLAISLNAAFISFRSTDAGDNAPTPGPAPHPSSGALRGARPPRQGSSVSACSEARSPPPRGGSAEQVSACVARAVWVPGIWGGPGGSVRPGGLRPKSERFGIKAAATWSNSSGLWEVVATSNFCSGELSRLHPSTRDKFPFPGQSCANVGALRANCAAARGIQGLRIQGRAQTSDTPSRLRGTDHRWGVTSWIVTAVPDRDRRRRAGHPSPGVGVLWPGQPQGLQSCKFCVQKEQVFWGSRKTSGIDRG